MKPEAAIQKAVLEYLAAKGIWHRRMNSGATVSQYGGKTRLIRYGSAGMGDVICTPMVETELPQIGETVLIPRILWLEIKTSKGAQSEAQKAFEAEVVAAGHYYAVIRSIDDLEAVLREIQ